MKKLTLAFLFIATLSCLKAGELIDNGDFSRGFERWHGDVTDDSSDSNPLASSSTTTGLALALKPDRWIKIYQEFVGHSDKLDLTVQYKFSPDLAFSQNGEDYKNVTQSIGYDAWKPIKLGVQEWCLFVSDFGPDHGRYFKIKSKFGTDTVQTVTASFPGKDEEKKTFTIAFPPGQGTVTLLKVSVTDGQ